MKVIFAAFALLSCGIHAASEDLPRQMRVSLQFIEVTHPMLSEMLSGKETNGPAFHDRADTLCKQGKAKLLETCMLVCRNGQQATLETICEEIYPMEYESPGRRSGPTVIGGLDPGNNLPPSPLFRAPVAFDTRNTGVTFKVISTLSSTHTIDLQLSPEIVTPLRLETWMEHIDQRGDASIRMPIYETWKLNNSLRVESGKFELVSVITPKPNAPVPAVLRKIMVFVRADILPVPE
ncbi:MAG: hypothetical protein ABIS50_25455 [Luteolibacter sp.]|uniref:hypothetical protein n=1 Tax=Luteolibacter sp. TaxID=1962973 RepID=UPI003263FA35